MGQQGFRTLGNNPYVYQEIDSGVSVAYGVDTATNLINIKAQATVGAVPTGTGQIQINPAAVGNITLTPNGAAGRVVVPNNFTVSAGTVVLTPLSSARMSTVRAGPTGVLGTLIDSNVDGQLFISSSLGAPAWANITGGPGVTITPGHNSIAISLAGGLTWTAVPGNAVALAVNTGYILQNAGLTTATLPALCSVGDIIKVTGVGAGLFEIRQNAGQAIKFGSISTTPGVTGLIASTVQYDVIEILCVVSNKTFVALSSFGNLTVS